MKPTSQLQSFTCHMGSHIVTFHPTQVNTCHFNPSLYSIYLPWRDGRVTDNIPRRFNRPQMVAHLSTNSALNDWESNSQSVDYEADSLTTTPPSYLS